MIEHSNNFKNLVFEVLPPILNFVGAIVIGLSSLISNKEATKIGVMRWGSDNEEENAKLPAVKDRIKQRKLTVMGLVILFIGLFLQLISLNL